MKILKGRTAVITGAASGLGLETARLAAERGMNVVMADVQDDALEVAAAGVRARGAAVLPLRTDVRRAADLEALAAATLDRFGTPNFVFNNAGVIAGGLVWESSVEDWEWVLGVNLMGVVHGVRVFTPLMLRAAQADADYEGHIVNTASMAGLVNPPNMGVYNVSKHAVVSLSETLYQDLALVTAQIGASVLCPFFVPTGIHRSQHQRPEDLRPEKPAPSRSALVAETMLGKAVTNAKVSAAEVAEMVLTAVSERRFYVYSHPNSLGSVRTRLEDVVSGRNPTDPFADKPHLGAELRAALKSGQ